MLRSLSTVKIRLEHFLSAPTSKTVPWELHSRIYSINMYYVLFFRQGSRPKCEATHLTLLHRTVSYFQIYVHYKHCALIMWYLVINKPVKCYVGLFEIWGYGDIPVDYASSIFRTFQWVTPFGLSFICKQQASLLNIYAMCTNLYYVIPNKFRIFYFRLLHECR
jgi:hypothetical protein